MLLAVMNAKESSRFQFPRTRTTPLLIVAIALMLSSCNRGEVTVGPQKAKVAGEVLWEGKPLPEGQIVFVDLSGDAPRSYVFDIRAGKFGGESTSGKKRVEVRAFRAPTGSAPAVPGPGDDTQFIPARYNVESTLTAEIEPGQPNDALQFKLTSS